MKQFVSDLKKIRAQARMHMEAGAVTEITRQIVTRCSRY